MYKRHKLFAALLFVIVLFVSLLVPLNYEKIAEVAITVISISLAVYISVATSLLGSAFSKSLKRLPDREDPHKSMLGVLSSYLRWAGAFSVMTIVISSIYLIWPEISDLSIAKMGIFSCLVRISSALACALFAINILFMGLIMEFLVVSLNNAAILRDSEI